LEQDNVNRAKETWVRRAKNSCGWGLAVLLLLLPAGCPSSDALSGGTSPTADTEGSPRGTNTVLPEVDPNDPQLLLLSQAEELVEATFPQAVLVEARGTPAGAVAAAASEVVAWQFLFMEDPLAPGASTVVLEYADGEFGEPELLVQGLVGTMYERLPRTMTLATAVQFMRDAGYTGSFSQVVLRKPLTFPVPDEAYYAFTLAHRVVLVGMATGEVSEE
jgi:hypothetical protein